MGIISLNLYIQHNFFLKHADKEITLNKQVKAYIKKGSIKEIRKLVPESLKKMIWVF